MNFELGQVASIFLSILFHRTDFSTLSKQETDLFERKFPLKLDRYSFTFQTSTVHDQTPSQGIGFRWNVLCFFVGKSFHLHYVFPHKKKKKDNTADLSFTSRTSNVQHFSFTFVICDRYYIRVAVRHANR